MSVVIQRPSLDISKVRAISRKDALIDNWNTKILHGFHGCIFGIYLVD